MRPILLSLVILRLAEESSLSTHKLNCSAPLQDPSPVAQDDKSNTYKTKKDRKIGLFCLGARKGQLRAI